MNAFSREQVELQSPNDVFNMRSQADLTVSICVAGSSELCFHGTVNHFSPHAHA